MSSYEEQNNDNFKLVSLDGNTPKSGAQQAKRAYSSYLKDDEYQVDNTSSLQISEVDPTASEPVPPPPAPKPQPSKTVNKQQTKGTKPLSGNTQNLNATPTSPLKNKNGKSYDTSDDVDLFSGEPTAEEVSERLGELKSSVSSLFLNVKNTLFAASLKGVSTLMKPIGKIAGLTAKMANIPLKLINNGISSLSNKMGQSAKALGAKDANEIRQEEQIQEAPPEIKTSSFNEMIELNIFFTDNYKKALYNKPKNAGFKLSKMEEELICGMAIEAIKECAEFTAELPPPASGIYEGRAISEVMENVTNDDIAIFLGFVKGFPGKYIGKTWKISETFATWLINNSPLG
ncbi:MAG: hypothetical protein U0354_00835 [Candidatus Sericytochromatia bacterium]